MKELYLIRHGLTEENELRIIVGSNNPPLSSKGRKELQAIRQYVTQPDIILSSDQKRAHETAEILFPDTNIKLLPQLRERDFGILEGQPIDYARETGLMQNQDEETLNKNGLETPSSLIMRAKYVAELLSPMQDQKIVVVSHGTIIGYLMRALLPEGSFRETLQHTNYNKIVFNSEGKAIDVKLNQSWRPNQ